MYSNIDLMKIPKADNKFILDKCIYKSVNGKIYEAFDTESNRKIAIKIRHLTGETLKSIEEECKTLGKISNHENLIEFYGTFRQDDNIWFATEFCSAGSIKDLVIYVTENDKRLAEEHIAFILRETVKGLMHLHNNNIIHRNIKADNIIVTNNGDIKLIGYSISKNLKSSVDQTNTNIGSPEWMAPEIIICDEREKYGYKVDVWSLGITAIELAEGKTPFDGMHPTRILFQIVRNPPPKLTKAYLWSNLFDDFTTECLEKNPNYRPFLEEIAEHPFLTSVPENGYYLNMEIKQLMTNLTKSKDVNVEKNEQIVINGRKILTHLNNESQEAKKIYYEDLASMKNITEKTVLEELYNRFKCGLFHTFIGDILLILNPNEPQDIYGGKYHSKYYLKSRSDNAPHIYSVASSAYQYALHHNEPQFIILTGESRSGKSTNLSHLIDHFLYLGNATKIKKNLFKAAQEVLQFMVHARTPMNKNSTRCVLQTKILFGNSGNFSSYHFEVTNLEKSRVSSFESTQGNFHIFYYFYDGMKNSENLERYYLSSSENYYLLTSNTSTNSENCKKFEEFNLYLEEIGIDSNDIDNIYQILAAILLIGNIEFRENQDQLLYVKNKTICENIANLLSIDADEFIWALFNFSTTNKGKIETIKHSYQSTLSLRNTIINNLYLRLINWIVHLLNVKISFGKIVFGEKYSVTIFDMFGFECNKQNNLEQLLINTFNEQQQYLYNQRVFNWEDYDKAEEHIPVNQIAFIDNKPVLDQLLCYPNGVFSIIDDVSKSILRSKRIIEDIQEITNKTKNLIIFTKNCDQFAVCHYTGKVTYHISGMSETNRDYLSKDIIEVFQKSENSIISMFFTNDLNRCGNLKITEKPTTVLKKWTAALNNANNHGGIQFVRCIRTDLRMKSKKEFNMDLIDQQLRAMQIYETLQARQKGFPYRIRFHDFLKRYQFLAFDFNENVEVNKDNCRLLLVRLKMEGWAIGKSKVFLTYYSEEYLSRMYEIQVKKVIKIQSMMRTFLTKKLIKNKFLKVQKSIESDQLPEMTAEDAALVVQKHYRGHLARKTQSTGYSSKTALLLEKYTMKWKSKTIFQILLQYRATRYQDLVNFCQQVHIFNQIVVYSLKSTRSISLDKVDSNAQHSLWFTGEKRSVWKMPFRLDEIPFFDTSYLSDPLMKRNLVDFKELEVWDIPLRWKQSISSQIAKALHEVYENEELGDKDKLCQKVAYLQVSFVRDENEIISRMDDLKLITSPIKQPMSSSNAIEKLKSPTKNVQSKKNHSVIQELEALSKYKNEKQMSNDDDSPPFDFRKILRKTNYKRESMKRADNYNNNIIVNNYKHTPDENQNIIHQFSLAPGILMEGIVCDL